MVFILWVILGIVLLCGVELFDDDVCDVCICFEGCGDDIGFCVFYQFGEIVGSQYVIYGDYFCCFGCMCGVYGIGDVGFGGGGVVDCYWDWDQFLKMCCCGFDVCYCCWVVGVCGSEDDVIFGKLGVRYDGVELCFVYFSDQWMSVQWLFLVCVGVWVQCMSDVDSGVEFGGQQEWNDDYCGG